jgi:hypothetical protein
VRAQYGHHLLVAEILAFIDAESHRGLIRSSRSVGEDDEG